MTKQIEDISLWVSCLSGSVSHYALLAELPSFEVNVLVDLKDKTLEISLFVLKEDGDPDEHDDYDVVCADVPFEMLQGEEDKRLESIFLTIGQDVVESIFEDAHLQGQSNDHLH